MLLAIDVGNTNVVFALVRGEDILHRWRIATDRKRTADQYMVWLGQLMQMEGVERGDVHAAIIASVVPQALFDLKLLCHSFFHVDPLVVGQPAQPVRGRRGPAGERRRRAGARAAAAHHRRFRHRHHVRRRRRRRRL
jgi:pantothenate kinase type III